MSGRVLKLPRGPGRAIPACISLDGHEPRGATGTFGATGRAGLLSHGRIWGTDCHTTLLFPALSLPRTPRHWVALFFLPSL